jgi:hypothetical protein
VGATGYVLAGGHSPILGRSFGWAAEYVTKIEVVGWWSSALAGSLLAPRRDREHRAVLAMACCRCGLLGSSRVRWRPGGCPRSA